MTSKEMLIELEERGFITVHQWRNACDYLELFKIKEVQRLKDNSDSAMTLCGDNGILQSDCSKN